MCEINTAVYNMILGPIYVSVLYFLWSSENLIVVEVFVKQ